MATSSRSMATVVRPPPAVPSYLIPGKHVTLQFTVTKGDKSSGSYSHLIFFKNDDLTVDGTYYGKVTDPKNQPFLKVHRLATTIQEVLSPSFLGHVKKPDGCVTRQSLHEFKCPDDFCQGIHAFSLARNGDMSDDDDDYDDEDDDAVAEDPNIDI